MAADPLAEANVVDTHAAFTVQRVEKADLLFVIDNSNSMAAEQRLLRAQIPGLIEVLTKGERFPGDPKSFTPIRDLHLGVVSADMGLPGVEFPPCHADGGDDGRLQHTSHPESGLTCDTSYPQFLSFDGSGDSDKLAADFSCVAALGTGGCGFEQQLEAPFKALWPSVYRGKDGNEVRPNPFTFMSTSSDRSHGLGDVPAAIGGNDGFLRNEPDDPSLLAIVVMTDEEDCSVKSTEHLKPTNQLPEDSPYRKEDINLRCFYHQDLSYDVMERYFRGFRALRPGRPDLVVFSAIAGVPADLVDATVLASTDFSDDAQRARFYDTLQADPRMQQEPDVQVGTGNGNLKPSCVRGSGDEVATAYPPVRIVKLARAFGEQGLVQSICQDDFRPALDSILNVMAKPLSEMCMSQQVTRAADGSVNCRLYWQLPAAGTPHDCAELGDVLAPGSAPEQLADGSPRCEIRQLAVQNGIPSAGRGWYYDDFSPGLEHKCSEGLTSRVAFADASRPPRGVSVKLECSAQ
jgi:hypothetical protein